MFENTNKLQNILNKIKQDKTYQNDKAIVDVKMDISSYDKVVQIVTHNDSHVPEPTEKKQESNTQKFTIIV